MLRILLVSAVALTLGASAYAQQQKSDPELMSHAQQLAQKWTHAVNSGDAKTMMSLETPDAVTVNAYGMLSGSAREQEIANVKKMGIKLQTEVTKVEPLQSGNEALAFGTYHVTYESNPTLKSSDGNWMQVLQKEGSEWKIKAMALARMSQPNAASGSSTGTTSSGTTSK